jgi:hypothetical protein
MRVENIATGEMVRIPRKLKKKVHRDLITIDGSSKFAHTPWFIFLKPINEWVPVSLYK